MENFFWKGYCNKDSISAIKEIEQIINRYGYIQDFKQFSDMSISINIVLEELNIDHLYHALNNYMDLDDYKLINPSSGRECLIFLNITFTKGTGDAKVDVPAVPG